MYEYKRVVRLGKEEDGEGGGEEKRKERKRTGQKNKRMGQGSNIIY